MTKNYNHFKSIKKIITSTILLTSLAFTNNALAIFPVGNVQNEPSITYYINQMSNCTSDYQLEQYMEQLSDDHLKKLYDKFFKIASHASLCPQLLRARLIISKVQVQREFAKVRQNSKMSQQRASLKAVKKSKTSKQCASSETAATNRHTEQHVTPETVTECSIPEQQSFSSNGREQKAFGKEKPATVKMHTCRYCKQRCPIYEKSIIFECKNCGRKNMKYVCEQCLEERGAKALVGKLRVRKKCHFCKQ